MNAPTQSPPAHLAPSSPLMCALIWALTLTCALSTLIMLTACEDNRPPQLLPPP